MTVTGAGRWALLLAGLTFLAGCEQMQDIRLFDKPLFSGQEGDPAATASSARPDSTATIEKDVEAPEVFERAESGLWDGRPSLGGVWVAHPDVGAPERVIIRNEDNGRSIIGALFRRERENPGPRFQVSSDAAAELGMLAGAPARLKVTALRRVEVPLEPAPQERETAPAPDDAAGSTPPVAATGDTATGDTGAGTGSAQAPVDQAPVDDVARIAASAIEEATAAAGTGASGAAPGGAETAAAPAAPRATAKKPALQRPFVQIGIFSVRENADNTANLLRNSGVVPTIRTFDSNGKTYWRVIVGPFSSKADLGALLRKVAGLGFPDAYPVTN